MTDGYMYKYDTIVGIIVMVLVIASSVLFVKCEDNKYNHCKYLIVFIYYIYIGSILNSSTKLIT